MPKLISVALLLITANLNFAPPALSCTDFIVKPKDGSVIVGRSMEWGANLDSQVWKHVRGESRASQTPDGNAALSWHSKYGYLGLDANHMPLTVDGVNEKGLSAGLLWLPGSTYQDVSAARAEDVISLVDLNDWLLGNFATVADVKIAMAKIKVWAPQLAEWGGVPTAHLAIHDSLGNSAVIEFINGEQKIYDNPLGVLTNAPTFDWHQTNLKNYINISAANAHPAKISGTVLAPPGQGGGFLGIPGDWTPPSRFVRTNAMLAFSKPVDDAVSGVNLTLHILNAVDIPLGDVRQQDNSFAHSDYTQWVILKDLKNSVLYFRSYDNLNLRAIDMKKIDFTATGQTQKITSISGGAPQVNLP